MSGWVVVALVVIAVVVAALILLPMFAVPLKRSPTPLPPLTPAVLADLRKWADTPNGLVEGRVVLALLDEIDRLRVTR